jgi:hypothetical protein
MVDLAQGQVGPEAKYKLSLESGKLMISMDYDGVQADASLAIKLEVDMFIDQLKALIPGKIDDMIFDLLKGAMK